MWDLEDWDGIVRCILWPEPFAEFGHFVQPDAILAMRALVDRRPGSEEINLIVQELIPLAELSTRFTSGVLIRVREDAHGEAVLPTLREILRGYPGPKPVKLHLVLADGGNVLLDCSKSGVTLDPELRRRVDDLLGPGNFKLTGNGAKQSSPPAPTNGRRRAMARSG
jgi:DNA polymerase-3 subunit alpha